MQSNDIKVQLNAPQHAALLSDKREVFLIGGVGMGKSFFLGLRLYYALCEPDTVHALFAPTKKTLNNSTLRQVQSAWKSFGFRRGENYVINTRPPAHWDVPPFSSINNKGVITTRWGSYCIVDGLDNFDSQRGAEFDSIFVDEFRDIDPEARGVLLGRLRGKQYTKLKIKHRIFYATTPPDRVEYLREIYESNPKDTEFIFGTTHANAQHLSADYVSSLKERYDEVTYRREVLGELISNIPQRPFAYAFSREKHIQPAPIRNNEIVYLSFDFNVDPITCAAFHIEPFHYFHQIAEFRLSNSNIYELCDVVKAAFPNSVIMYTGDASGSARSVFTRGHTNLYDVIESQLGLSRNQKRVPNANPSISDSRVLLNSILQNHPDVRFDPSCKFTIADLEYVQTDDKGGIDKRNSQQSHLLDCVRYAMNEFLRDFIRFNR